MNLAAMLVLILGLSDCELCRVTTSFLGITNGSIEVVNVNRSTSL